MLEKAAPLEPRGEVWNDDEDGSRGVELREEEVLEAGDELVVGEVAVLEDVESRESWSAGWENVLTKVVKSSSDVVYESLAKMNCRTSPIS